MQAHVSDLEKIRQQFDSAPYPRISIDKSSKNEPLSLYIHSLVTPYYLGNQKVIPECDRNSDVKQESALTNKCLKKNAPSFVNNHSNVYLPQSVLMA